MGIKEGQKKLITGIAALIVVVTLIYIVTQKPYDEGNFIETESGDEYSVLDYVDPSTVPEPLDPGAAFDFDSSLTMGECNSLDGDDKDSCIFLVSAAEANYGNCSLIADRDLQDLCLQEIAYNTNDATPCSMAIYWVSDCYYDLAIKTNNASLCENTEYEAQKCLEAFNANDLGACEKTGNERVYCNFAVIKKWRELCDLRRVKCIVADKKDEIGQCFEEENIESTECLYNEMKNDPELCTGMPGLKSYCYERVAVATGNPGLCDNADVRKPTCYYKLALETDNANLCSFTGELKDNCIAWVAFNTNNPALCQQAGSEKESCLSDLA